jgi:hypothetical protein
MVSLDVGAEVAVYFADCSAFFKGIVEEVVGKNLVSIEYCQHI